jgi:hypothetical protein
MMAVRKLTFLTPRPASKREREVSVAKQWEGEGKASTISLERPSPGRRRYAPAATLFRFEAR